MCNGLRHFYVYFRHFLRVRSILRFNGCILISVVVYFSGKVLPAKNGRQYHHISSCSILVLGCSLDIYDLLPVPIEQPPTFRHLLGFNDTFGAQIPSVCASLTILFLRLLTTPPFLLIREKIRVRCLDLYYRCVDAIISPHIAVLRAYRAKFHCNILIPMATPAELWVMAISVRATVNIPLLPMQPLSPLEA